MNRFLFAVSMLVVSFSAYAGPQPGIENLTSGTASLGRRFGWSLVKLMPNDLAAYERGLSGDNTVADVQSSLFLLSKAKDLALTPSTEISELRDRHKAYTEAWEICLRARRESGDPQARQTLLEGWNESLRADDVTVPWQLASLLSDEWDRTLLTEDFWRLLQSTKKKKTRSAICSILLSRGESADEERLRQIAKTATDDDLRDVITRTLRYMEYRRQPSDPMNPGPATAPPIIE
ncbi:hypothetical protein JW916_14945 [Candidatus Sumerlaeota bacterium]|nr:hypothetical protein [Candidatus Sumerlaeota bacterium]